IAALFLVPLAVGLVILGRVLGGKPALTDRELRLFGYNEDITLSLWMWLKFVVLVVLFFALGFFQGSVLINLGPFWRVLAPLFTGIGAMLILLQWLSGGGRATASVVRLCRTLGDSEQERHESHDRKTTTEPHPAHTRRASSARFPARNRSSLESRRFNS
ncbi:MAG TPA: hypothetical protein VFM35_07095, partial [Candidatus Binatia bacterium]|nr:hypothetical protein [Candidatus Binatia bacterium]